MSVLIVVVTVYKPSLKVRLQVAYHKYFRTPDLPNLVLIQISAVYNSISQSWGFTVADMAFMVLNATS